MQTERGLHPSRLHIPDSTNQGCSEGIGGWQHQFCCCLSNVIPCGGSGASGKRLAAAGGRTGTSFSAQNAPAPEPPWDALPKGTDPRCSLSPSRLPRALSNGGPRRWPRRDLVLPESQTEPRPPLPCVRRSFYLPSHPPVLPRNRIPDFVGFVVGTITAF